MRDLRLSREVGPLIPKTITYDGYVNGPSGPVPDIKSGSNNPSLIAIAKRMRQEAYRGAETLAQ